MWRARLCAQTWFGCWEEESLCFTTRRHRSGSKQDPEHPWVVPPRSSIPTPLLATGSAQQFPISNIPSPLPYPRAAPPAELLLPAPTRTPDPFPMTQDFWGAWKGASHPPAPFASHPSRYLTRREHLQTASALVQAELAPLQRVVYPGTGYSQALHGCWAPTKGLSRGRG